MFNKRMASLEFGLTSFVSFIFSLIIASSKFRLLSISVNLMVFIIYSPNRLIYQYKEGFSLQYELAFS